MAVEKRATPTFVYVSNIITANFAVGASTQYVVHAKYFVAYKAALSASGEARWNSLYSADAEL
jgi:hypothetical protein